MPATETYADRITRERAEQTQAEQAVVRLLVEVGPLLPGWTLEPNRFDFQQPDLVHTKTGARVIFRLAYPAHGGRIRALATWPTNVDGSAMSPRYWGVTRHDEPFPDVITFRLDKPAAKVAAELERRLLRAYLPLFEACMAKKAEATAQRDKVDDARTRLVAILRGKGSVADHGKTIYVDSPARGKIDVGYTGETADVNLTLPIDLAEELCAKIARLAA